MLQNEDCLLSISLKDTSCFRIRPGVDDEDLAILPAMATLTPVLLDNPRQAGRVIEASNIEVRTRT